jgi:hypothetical protein
MMLRGNQSYAQCLLDKISRRALQTATTIIRVEADVFAGLGASLFE